MATKSLGLGVTGDLVNDPLYNYGTEDDTVIVEADSGDHNIVIDYQSDLNLNFGLSIRTGAGDDRIDSTLADTGSSQWIFAGSGNDTVEGGDARESVADGSGNDRLVLGGGSDEILAGSGNDFYDGGAGSDDWISFGIKSIDAETNAAPVANTARVSINLSVVSAQNLGNFGLDTVRNIENVAGGAGDDFLTGNAANNKLYGGLGNDVIDGGRGNDELRGQQGRDVLIGGQGADTLYAGDVLSDGAARDLIVYKLISDSGLTSATQDKITGFDRGGLANDDKIDLSAVDANIYQAGNQAFQFSAAGPGLPGNGGKVWLTVRNGDTVVNVDNDYDVAAEMTFVVKGVTGLTAADFIL
jgi:Ca2+-binding RTX toxin-like protein